MTSHRSPRQPITNGPSARALSSLIASIYDCALDPSRWEHALNDIRQALDSHAAVLHLNDLRADRVLIHKHTGMEQCWLEQHARHIPEMHALLPRRPSLDEPHVLSRHVDGDLIENSPFVREWLKPQGLIDIMQLFLLHTPERFSGLGIAWHERHGVVTDDELELASLLLPHVRRAVTISNVLEVRTVKSTRMAATLDALRCAVVLTDEHGAILFANRSASNLLRDAETITDARGKLQAKFPPAATELRDAIGLAARGEPIGNTGLAIRLTASDNPPLFAHVLPMATGVLRATLQPDAVAAVFIGLPPEDRDIAEAIAAAFHLTRAETRILGNLLAGRTLAETAAVLRLSATTVKTHLGKIFEKAGVKRQSDLMRLAAQFVSPTTGEPDHDDSAG